MEAVASLCGYGNLDEWRSEVNRFWYREYSSPVGQLQIAGDDLGVVSLDFDDFSERMRRLIAARFGEHELCPGDDPFGVVPRLDLYFRDGVDTFHEIPLNMRGSPLQAEVWRALRMIPAGETRSYGQLALQLGRPKASRAVGHANSLNPVGIIVPCHRVIGANGKLTGYAGGVHRKEWLLRHEQQSHKPLLFTA
jgi:O-6-methylguanine DNA methyltransferase